MCPRRPPGSAGGCRRPPRQTTATGRRGCRPRRSCRSSCPTARPPSAQPHRPGIRRAGAATAGRRSRRDGRSGRSDTTHRRSGRGRRPAPPPGRRRRPPAGRSPSRSSRQSSIRDPPTAPATSPPGRIRPAPPARSTTRPPAARRRATCTPSPAAPGRRPPRSRRTRRTATNSVGTAASTPIPGAARARAWSSAAISLRREVELGRPATGDQCRTGLRRTVGSDRSPVAHAGTGRGIVVCHGHSITSRTRRQTGDRDVLTNSRRG